MLSLIDPTGIFTGLFGTLWSAFIHGGWLILVLGMIYVLYKLYTYEVIGQFLQSQSWIYLSVKTPKENLTSTLAAEQIFAQLHALFGGITKPQAYIEGRIQLWFSFEIVSLGGMLSFIIRAPKDVKELVESAVYSQYPNAEIEVVDDYMENLEYDPETSNFDLFGSEFLLVDDEALPIKTYREFEHPLAEQKIIDPLSPLLEGLSKMQPYEFYGVQIIAQPVMDNAWRPKAEAKAKQLLGEKVSKPASILDLLLKPFYLLSGTSPVDILKPAAAPTEEKKDKNNLLNMTEMEKEKVNLLQKKIAKPAFKCKIRHLYIAPKDRMDGIKKVIMIGAMKTFGSGFTNSFKPDTRRTWTDVKYKMSASLEKPFIDYLRIKRKKNIIKGYKDRSIFIGNPMQILNSEELATIFHLPLTTLQPLSQVATVESKKSQAPANLPVGEIEF